MIGKKVAVFMVSIALSVPVLANVTIVTESYQKVYDKKGKHYIWKEATKVVPGNVVRYVNTVSNNGSKRAEKLVVTNHIPEHMEYVRATAKCQSRCTIDYSVDGGKHFAKPDKLYIKDPKTKKRRLAKAGEYTTIRWTIDKLDPKKSTTVEFKARLK